MSESTTIKIGDVYWSPLFQDYVEVMDIYGRRRPDGSIHKGIDIRRHINPIGASLYAVEGTVSTIPFNPKGGFETWITNGRQYRYAHQKSRFVVNGERVGKGVMIGICGNTGHVVPPPTADHPDRSTHLHFEERVWDGKNWSPVDPTHTALDINHVAMLQPAITAYGKIVAYETAPIINDAGDYTENKTKRNDTIPFNRFRSSKQGGYDFGSAYEPNVWINDKNTQPEKTVWGQETEAQADMQKINEISSKYINK